MTDRFPGGARALAIGSLLQITQAMASCFMTLELRREILVARHTSVAVDGREPSRMGGLQTSCLIRSSARRAAQRARGFKCRHNISESQNHQRMPSILLVWCYTCTYQSLERDGGLILISNDA